MRIALSIAVWTLAFAGDPGQAATNCPKEGSVRVHIEDRTFTVPRLVLRRVGALSNEREQHYYCDEAQSVRAANLFINATSTWSGAQFYHEWLREKRLPPSIEIFLRNTRRSYTIDRLEAAKRSGYKRASNLDYGGFNATETSSEVYFDGLLAELRGFDNRGVAFSCFKQRIPRGGHQCDTSYPFDEKIGIRYSFNDHDFPIQEWVALDARVREYIGGLIKRN